MNIFNKIRVKKPGYSVFDLSHDVKLSMKMGKLVPVNTMEVVPGDRVHMASEAMFRMMPMIAPIMHKVDIYFHSFFVPNRILWPNWEKFITGGESIGVAPPAFPTINVGLVVESTLMNYLGLPVTEGVTMAATDVSALPAAAYHRIFCEYYRDENLQYLIEPIQLADGPQSAPDTVELKTLRDRAWEHDYFTSNLPFAQKGNAVDLPFDASGLEITASTTGIAGIEQPILRDSATGAPLAAADIVTGAGGAVGTAGALGYIDPKGYLDIEGSAGVTINDLRTAFSLQKWLEKNARAGSRYFESLLAHFGVRSPDARLQRPEYLGGSKATMAVSEVLQTSSSDVTTPQANMAGHGISITGGRDYTYQCQEHGYIMTICSIMPKTAYYNGVPRHYIKTEREDFYWPDFAFLGEQETKNIELNLTGNPTFDEGIFGYMPRYSEYRSLPSRVVGQMATTLDHWHMARKFGPGLGVVPLNEDFIKSDPTKRIFAVTDPDVDDIVAHIFHKIFARRPMPKDGTPGIF